MRLPISLALAIAAALYLSACGTTRTITHTVVSPSPSPSALPAITVTVTAPPPPPGTRIGKWSGSGNAVTPAFNAPATGDYVVYWTFWGNVDPQLGQPSNFIMSTTDPSATADGLPNVVQATGQGSTEVQGASGTESFNIQASGNWLIKVFTAP